MDVPVVQAAETPPTVDLSSPDEGAPPFGRVLEHVLAGGDPAPGPAAESPGDTSDAEDPETAVPGAGGEAAAAPAPSVPVITVAAGELPGEGTAPSGEGREEGRAFAWDRAGGRSTAERLWGFWVRRSLGTPGPVRPPGPDAGVADPGAAPTPPGPGGVARAATEEPATAPTGSGGPGPEGDSPRPGETPPGDRRETPVGERPPAQGAGVPAWPAGDPTADPGPAGPVSGEGAATSGFREGEAVPAPGEGLRAPGTPFGRGGRRGTGVEPQAAAHPGSGNESRSVAGPPPEAGPPAPPEEPPRSPGSGRTPPESPEGVHRTPSAGPPPGESPSRRAVAPGPKAPAAPGPAPGAPGNRRAEADETAEGPSPAPPRGAPGPADPAGGSRPSEPAPVVPRVEPPRPAGSGPEGFIPARAAAPPEQPPLQPRAPDAPAEIRDPGTILPDREAPGAAADAREGFRPREHQGPVGGPGQGSVSEARGPRAPAAPPQEARPAPGDGEHQGNLHGIARSVRLAWDRGRGEVRVRLDPPSLGRVQVTLSRDTDGVVARLKVETPEALKLLTAGTPALRHALESRGLEVSHVSVALEDRGDPERDRPRPRRERVRRSAGALRIDGDETAASPGPAWRPRGFETLI